jgi:hypothetical protein
VTGAGAHGVLEPLRRGAPEGWKTVGRTRPDEVLPDLRTTMALADASGGPLFLPGGRPGSDSLVLVAMQVHRYETACRHLAAGLGVVEVDGVHDAAVRAALAHRPEDVDAAHEIAVRVLRTVAAWRPLPDRVLLVTGPEEEAGTGPWESLSAELFERLAADAPRRFRVVAAPPAADADAVAAWLEDLKGGRAARRGRAAARR